MATSTFIPTVWSETLLTELDREYIGVRNCNRDFEGDIKDKGSSVKIIGIDNIAVFDYTKNTNINTAQTITASKDMTLNIDQAKGFNFLIDDIDRAQAQPKLMKAAMHQAAIALADVADKYVYSLHTEAPARNRITVDILNSDNIIELIIFARETLLANGVSSNAETYLEISPQVATQILHATIFGECNSSISLETGLIGKLLGFDVYVTNNIAKDAEGRHQCLIRTKRAISFAEQLNEIEAYRPESRFADAVRGLHLYGAKVVYPEELIVLDVAA